MKNRKKLLIIALMSVAVLSAYGLFVRANGSIIKRIAVRNRVLGFVTENYPGSWLEIEPCVYDSDTGCYSCAVASKTDRGMSFTVYLTEDGLSVRGDIKEAPRVTAYAEN